MWRYGFKLALVAIGLLVAGIVAIVLFEGIWARVGLGAAIIVVMGGLLLIAWYVDRKDKAARADIDELPPV
jgi:Flp pilus assembly protein TadB